MGHFIAFYKCKKCEEVIGGLVSNTRLLVVDDEKGLFLINPQEIGIQNNLELFCKNCGQLKTGSDIMNLECEACEKKFELFYKPNKILIIHKNVNIFVGTENLLTECKKIAFCSVYCYKKQIGNGPEPIFLDW